MALIECERCHGYYTDKIVSCPHCGYIRHSILYCPECGMPIKNNVESCPECGYVYSKVLSIKNETLERERSLSSNIKRRNVILTLQWPHLTRQSRKTILSIVLIALLIAGSVLIHLLRVSQFNTQISNIEAGYLEETQYWLQHHQFAYKREKLFDVLNRSFEVAIDDNMEAGNYIRAQELLNHVPYLDDYFNTQEYIIYETFALSAASDLRKIYKNPSSLQIQSIDFYENPSSRYPYCVASCSGQNGFGGYSSSYSYFEVTNSANSYSCQGSCESLYTYLNDDFSDILVAMEINDIVENKKIGSVDLARINRILSSGQSIYIDIALYINEQKSTI